MSARLTLSIDVMGGDAAPQMVVDGVALAAANLADVDFLLFGDEAGVSPLVRAHSILDGRIRIRHTSDVVAANDKPSVALRSGRNSSMRLAINAVHDGEAAGIVSAGNTGALMAMAKFVLKTLSGIDRPAIAGLFPNMRGQSVVLDLGANVECDADNLVQFAIMGEVFARRVLAIESPLVGLLNVGVEELKGHDDVKRASSILQQTRLPIRFRGFVEGDDITAGTVDVIVTDGFTGNIVLKAVEGTAKMFGRFLKESLTSTLPAQAGALLARPALRRFRDRIDPRLYNGAMFLGLDGICV
ncbi:MAG: phosphate acyltransferase PlsX, partial [Alphaproteobacteria bacterium]|nr:phosphate acyltransferase PlsX [Alphaproteobacteria bacterium]